MPTPRHRHRRGGRRSSEGRGAAHSPRRRRRRRGRVGRRAVSLRQGVAPLPTAPKKKLRLPIASSSGATASYSACQTGRRQRGAKRCGETASREGRRGWGGRGGCNQRWPHHRNSTPQEWPHHRNRRTIGTAYHTEWPHHHRGGRGAAADAPCLLRRGRSAGRWPRDPWSPRRGPRGIGRPWPAPALGAAGGG